MVLKRVDDVADDGEDDEEDDYYYRYDDVACYHFEGSVGVWVVDGRRRGGVEERG